MSYKLFFIIKNYKIKKDKKLYAWDRKIKKNTKNSLKKRKKCLYFFNIIKIIIEIWKKKIIIKVYNYKHMIYVMRLDGKKYWVNPHMIESMESTPDLTLTMLSGRKIIVKNSPEDLIEKIIKYRRDIGIERQEVL